MKNFTPDSVMKCASVSGQLLPFLITVVAARKEEPESVTAVLNMIEASFVIRLLLKSLKTVHCIDI